MKEIELNKEIAWLHFTNPKIDEIKILSERFNKNAFI